MKVFVLPLAGIVTVAAAASLLLKPSASVSAQAHPPAAKAAAPACRADVCCPRAIAAEATIKYAMKEAAQRVAELTVEGAGSKAGRLVDCLWPKDAMSTDSACRQQTLMP